MKEYEITRKLQGGKKSRNTTMFKFFKKLTKQAIDDSAHYSNFQNYTGTVSLINSNKAESLFDTRRNLKKLEAFVWSIILKIIYKRRT